MLAVKFADHNGGLRRLVAALQACIGGGSRPGKLNPAPGPGGSGGRA